MIEPDVLRPMVEADLSTVLALNHAHVELLSPMDEARLRRLIGWACRSDVIECDGLVAGFVLVFAPGTAYDSPNYRWFTARYGERFHYLDRVVVDDRFRRRGLATAAYEVIEAGAADRERLVLEVNVDPPNQASLAFHEARGYQEVGRLGEEGHVVALMAKALGRSDHRSHTNAGEES
ncbi:MAG TPA: GNAT family N-acetyltransferase [Pedococcus sp.]|nr:GNAT family N-acetyltransferase [Pedococcus sp.]